jgi:hypothetical protein
MAWNAVTVAYRSGIALSIICKVVMGAYLRLVTHNDNRSETPLFLRRLSESRKPRSSFLLYIVKRYSNTSPEQLIFDFFIDQDNTVGFVPRHRVVCLRFEVIDVFESDPHLKDAGAKLTRLGFHYLGDLIRLSRNDLSQFSFINADVLDRIERRVGAYSLSLNSRTPLWRPQEQYRYL